MRTESDSFSKVEVPSDAYYGAFTQRAMSNFSVSGKALQRQFIHAYAIIKGSSAKANVQMGYLDAKTGKAIVSACDEIIAGKLDGQFPVDVFQAGAGTSTNMNLNEVIANRALEILGHKRGNYKAINPNDHVNMSQSTNDTFHDAMHIASCIAIRGELIPSLERYQGEIRKKGREFSRIMKSGRTHLMDAVPITLGQEFEGYSIGSQIKRLEESLKAISVLGIGGTAVGTGLNTDPRFPKLALKEINKYSGYRFGLARNRFALMQNMTGEAEISGSLKALSLKFIKVANDVRLMSSGPNTGINEITIPEVQPGSSIMPGKVNPSIPEMLDMVCFKVIGNDLTISMAAQAGQFELNVFGPVIAYALLESIEILSNGIKIFTNRCMAGVKPNKTVLEYNFEHSAALATVLSPVIGYAETSKLVKESLKRNIKIRDLVLEKKLIPKVDLDRLLSHQNLTKPNMHARKR